MTEELANQPVPEENAGEQKTYEAPNPTIKECIQLYMKMMTC